mgnify:CR=1 FL=1
MEKLVCTQYKYYRDYLSFLEDRKIGWFNNDNGYFRAQNEVTQYSSIRDLEFEVARGSTVRSGARVWSQNFLSEEMEFILC